MLPTCGQYVYNSISSIGGFRSSNQFSQTCFIEVSAPIQESEPSCIRVLGCRFSDPTVVVLDFETIGNISFSIEIDLCDSSRYQSILIKKKILKKIYI